MVKHWRSIRLPSSKIRNEIASIDQHCEDCKNLLGEHFNDVHMWLDHYAGVFPIQFFSDYHRSFRHNSYGLEVVRSLFGPRAEIAAKIHLVRDCEDWMCPLEFEKYTLDEILEKLPGSLLYLNDLENMEPLIHNEVVSGWLKDNMSLVAIAKGE